MGIEILLGIVVFPIAQKVGEKWIDRIATGIDEYSVQVLKDVVFNPSKEQEAKAYFRENPDVAGKLEQNIASTMQADDTTASLAATVVPPRGKRLDYYADLLRWIVRTGGKLGNQFVLKGFFHGEEYLSYFIFDPDEIETDDGISVIGNDSVSLNYYSGLHIYVQKCDSTEKWDERFVDLNRRVEFTAYGRFAPEDLARYQRIKQIYERYVIYYEGALIGRQSFLDLPREQQEELEIKSHTPITLMIQSLGELLQKRVQEDIELRRTMESAVNGLQQVVENVES